MPPPTSADPWLASRRFGVIIDAGSSGSRLQIYSWKDPKTATPDQAHLLPQVGKGSRNPDDWQYKTEPGVSSYYANPESVSEHLRPLLAHARQHIPPSLESKTPIFFLATAGMRLLSEDIQRELLKETCFFLRNHSHFLVEEASDAGPCGSSVRIITGEEEGLFGWIAVNYLMEGFTSGVHHDQSQTYGFLDMGGASAQIAFEPDATHRGQDKGLMDVRLRRLGGDEIHHQVFVTTWLGYGSNQARERYATTLKEAQDPEDGTPDPCLPKSLQIMEHVHDSDGEREMQLYGQGSFSNCLRSTLPILNKSVKCGPDHSPTYTCMFNGVSIPPIEFATSHFVGVSEYWYSSEQVFGLGGEWNYPKFEEQARKFCSQDWNELVTEYQAKFDHLGKAKKASEMERLKMQCFKAAWVSNVLHEGLGMPRVVDLQHGKSKDSGDQRIRDKPRFQSIDTIDGMAISWTLGKMVLEASKEIRTSGKPAPAPIPPAPTPPKSIPPPVSHPEEEVAIPYRSPSIEPIVFLLYFATLAAVVILSIRFRKQLFRPLRSFLHRFSFGRASLSSRIEEGYGFASRDPLSRTKPSLFAPRPAIGRTLSSSSTHTSEATRIVLTKPSEISRSNSGTSQPEPFPRIEGRVSPLPPLPDDEILAHTSSRSSSPVPSLSDSGTFTNGQLTPRSRTGSQFGPNNSSVLSPPGRFSNSYYQSPSSSGRVSRMPSSMSLKRDD